MKTNTIYYFGSYDVIQSQIKRRYSLPATTKMDYIISVLCEAGYNVNIISASYIIENKFIFEKGGEKTINTKTKLFIPSSFGARTIIGKYLGITFTIICTFLKLITLTRSDTLIVYHAPWYAYPIILAKKIIRFRLILEVEEIYANVNKTRKYDKMELKLIKSADAYLISTELLKNKILPNKPAIVIHGRYCCEKNIAEPLNDGKIHLLYAGIIDRVKAGAFNAIEGTKLLTSKYVLHIIGFGETDELKRYISIVNKESQCQIYYDGLLSGENYIKYCQQCHIGLSTQKMDGKFLESSFPSKILSYLSMGLNVVSGKIECVEKSDIGDIVNYYDNESPKAISKAIISANIVEREDIRKKIINLHNSFKLNLNNLITNIHE